MDQVGEARISRVRHTCPQSVSDMTKAVFLSNLRRPAGVVSTGKPMRIGRAGASGSKNAASLERQRWARSPAAA